MELLSLAISLPLDRWVHLISFDAASLACFGGQSYDFFNTLMVQTLVPIYCAVVLLFAWMIERNLRLGMFFGPDPSDAPKEQAVVAANAAVDTAAPSDFVLDPEDAMKEQAIIAVDTACDNDAQSDFGLDPEYSPKTEATAAADTACDSSAPSDFGSNCFALFVYLSYLVLPNVTTTIFMSYPSLNANPSGVENLPMTSEYLAVDYRIIYGSPRHLKCVIWSSIMIFVYPVGITVRQCWYPCIHCWY